MQRFSRSPVQGPRAGIAVLTVLLVLLALLVLTAPFLMTTRNASRAGAQLADAAQGRVALDSAARYARSELSRSHPSRDATPWSDDPSEVALEMVLDRAALDPFDARGVMWDAAAEDLAGWIDLGSAPPQVFANLLAASTRLNEPVEAQSGGLSVQSTAGFEDSGFLWVGRELIHYAGKDNQSFLKLTRGLLSVQDSKGKAVPYGPRPAGSHAPGTPVVDQRAWAPVVWRLAAGTGELRGFDAPERVREAASFAMAGLDEDALRTLEQGCSVYSGVRAGAVWQHPARIIDGLRGGESDILVLDQARWYSPGTSVRISDGRTTELGVVQEITDEGVRLMQPVVNDYESLTAIASPLARRPVNVNSASAATLELLFANLQLRGVNSRITREEARTLATLVVESRPFTGLEDFVRRLVLPAAGLETLPEDAPVVPEMLAGGSSGKGAGTGAGLISAHDAVALYANALNANDSMLLVSTLPLAFTTRDVYSLDLRAAVNAPSGVERAWLRREQVEMIVPQDDLLHAFARQEDFDEALRLSCEAPLWMSGPNATNRWDGGAAPPSRLWAHLGTLGDAPFVPGLTPLPPGTPPEGAPAVEHVFASREDDGWAQLEPSRVAEVGVRAGRMLHFDHETRDPEGRFLPDEPVQRNTFDPLVHWTPGAGEMLRALSFELWLKPRQLADGVILDVGQNSVDTDRVTLALEGPDLVLRVLDGAGDHPDTGGFREAGEARYSIAPGGPTGGAGFEADTWSHVFADVRGTRPDQITLLVDAQAFGVRTLGLTRLASALGEGVTVIQVEEDEGFPDRGVLRIGEELIEYLRTGPETFDCTRSDMGENAGFGGRIARFEFELATTSGVEPGQPAALASASFQTTHAAGTAVQLYGYSLPLESNVSGAKGQLSSDLGIFAVGVVEQVVGGSTAQGDPIDLAGFLFPADLGTGLGGASSQASGLTLKPADPGMTQAQVLDAFSSSGGYAAVIQRVPGYISGPGGGQVTNYVTSNNEPIFGVEIVRYSGHDGTTLFLSQRAALPVGTATAVPRAFVVEWSNVTIGGIDADLQLEWEVFVAPISLPVSGTGGSFGFPVDSGLSNYAQITYLGSAERTEWVRYNSVVNDQLVRNDPLALEALTNALAHGNGGTGDFTPPAPGGSGGQGGGFGTPGSGSGGSNQPPSSGGGPPTSAPPPSQGGGGAYWNPYVLDPTTPPDIQYPVTYAARTAFQFRGVAGTFPQIHSAGIVVLPTFRVAPTGSDGGMPGRHDMAFLFDGDRTSLGFAVHVHRAYRPNQHTYRPWTTGSNLLTPMAGQTTWLPEDPQSTQGAAQDWVSQWTWVALQDAAAIPVAAGSAVPNVSAYETREIARLVLHPSGERPRIVVRAVVGASIRGAEVPAATADEVVFGDPLLGDGTAGGPAIQGGQLRLVTDLPGGSNSFMVAPQALRVARGIYADTTAFLAEMPQDAGLLRIGTEIVCYSALDASTGVITIAQGGRGLLGTDEAYHEAGETATLLEAWPVSVLAAGAGGADSSLSIADADGFSPAGDTVRIDDELIHYTVLSGAALTMPRLSSTPGKLDHKGGGLFRGRFGTGPVSHPAGAPVILHPFRYWDRWEERADAPELAYFGFEVEQPNAFWRNAFFEAEEPSGGSARVGVLQRLVRHPGEAPPWDADPEATPGLVLLEEGLVDGANPIGRQGDRIEWRAHVVFSPGAFDFAAGTAHGWKQTPRLRLLGVSYLGPDLVLRRVER